MTDGVTGKRLLRERVAEEVRALLARRMMTGADLATAIGRSPMYVSRRIRGEVAFDLDDMERLAGVFGIDVADLLPRSVGALKDGYGETIRSATPHRPKRHARRVAVKTPTPIGHGRRDSTRPVSAIPANRRRPVIVGMGNRPMPR